MNTASSTQVKCAASDLIDNTVTGSYKGYPKVAKYEIPKGLVVKEIANIVLYRRKNKDLEKLKCFGECQARLMST